MQSLYEDEVMRVDYDETEHEIVIVNKHSDQQDNILFVRANSNGSLSIVAPASTWHPAQVGDYCGFRIWLN